MRKTMKALALTICATALCGALAGCETDKAMGIGGQVQRPSGLHTLALGVEAETPHPVQADETAGGGSAGIQQGAVHQDDLTFISPAAFCVPQERLLSLYPV